MTANVAKLPELSCHPGTVIGVLLTATHPDAGARDGTLPDLGAKLCGVSLRCAAWVRYAAIEQAGRREGDTTVTGRLRLHTLLMGKSIRQKISLFEVTDGRVRPGDIVFLGDSITEGGWWNDWFEDLPVRNRGIAGDLTQGVLDRLHQVLDHPAQLFLMIGTNDVTFGVKDEQILGNVEQLLLTVRRTCPATELYLQSLLPRKAKHVDRLRNLNAEYARLAGKHGAEFVDLWPVFADENGAMKAEYSNDTIHLLGSGYVAWVAILRTLLPTASAPDARTT